MINLKTSKALEFHACHFTVDGLRPYPEPRTLPERMLAKQFSGLFWGDYTGLTAMGYSPSDLE